MAGGEAGGGMISTIILGAIGLVIVLIAAIQLWRGQRPAEIEELDLATLTNSLTAGSARPVLPRIEATPAPATATAASSAAGGTATEDEEPEPVTPEQELRALVDSQPDEVARLLRTWLADRRAVTR